MTANSLTQERLKELLRYCPLSGKFAWIRNGRKAGWVDSQGYVRVKVDHKEHKGHKLAWLYINGIIPNSHMDHIDHNRANNAIDNLRLCSQSENSKNASLRKDNKSGFSGVRFCNRQMKWVAKIRISGFDKHLGYFEHKIDAAIARKMAEYEYGFHQNHGT